MEVKLDLKDRKILYELDINSRQSFGVVAKKVGLSKNAVIYRINHLKAQGIIKGFHALIDQGKLGYIQFRIYLNLKTASPKKEAEILDFLSRKKIITLLESMDGAYNVAATGLVKNIVELHELWDELFKKYVNYIESRLLTLIAKNEYYYRAYLVNLKNNHLHQTIMTPAHEEILKEIDLRIIKMLADDARISIIALADRLKVTPKTIIAHIKDLEKRKVIVGYGTSLDLEKIGYQTFRISFILFRLTPEKMKNFRDYAMNNPNIIYDEEVIGGDDYEIEIQAKDLVEFRKIVDDIKSRFADIVQDYRILFVFKISKNLSIP